MQELRRQQEEEVVKRGSGLQQEYPVLENNSQRKTFSLLVTREVEVEVQAWIYVSSLLLKSEPPRGLLSTGLVPQSPYNFIPLSNQSYLLMKVPT